MCLLWQLRAVLRVLRRAMSSYVLSCSGRSVWSVHNHCSRQYGLTGGSVILRTISYQYRLIVACFAYSQKSQEASKTVPDIRVQGMPPRVSVRLQACPFVHTFDVCIVWHCHTRVFNMSCLPGSVVVTVRWSQVAVNWQFCSKSLVRGMLQTHDCFFFLFPNME